ncbi:MAG TPA: hypothetical protein VGC72_05705 [Candidatus Elarobacter sp.]|jgi:hypothetical protein
MIATMTVHERLLDTGADEREAHDAEALLGRFMPHGRPIEITDEVLNAARRGDHVTIVCLLAEEVEPDAIDLAMLAEAQALNDGTTIGVDMYFDERAAKTSRTNE